MAVKRRDVAEFDDGYRRFGVRQLAAALEGTSLLVLDPAIREPGSKLPGNKAQASLRTPKRPRKHESTKPGMVESLSLWRSWRSLAFPRRVPGSGAALDSAAPSPILPES